MARDLVCLQRQRTFSCPLLLLLLLLHNACHELRGECTRQLLLCPVIDPALLIGGIGGYLGGDGNRCCRQQLGAAWQLMMLEWLSVRCLLRCVCNW